MNLYLAALLAVQAVTPAPQESNLEAESGADYFAALCSLSGEWSGQMAQFEGAEVVRTFPFELKLECLSEAPFVIETNTFHIAGGSGGPLQTLRIIFPKQESQTMHMSYFFAGTEKMFLYESKRVEFENNENWTIVRQSIPDKEADEAGTSNSRYTHSRNGSQLTMLRETNSDAGTQNWKLSSKLTLSRIP
ncbi:MAG: hypothetical protein ABJP70_00400 [Erythrobacter sp.]